MFAQQRQAERVVESAWLQTRLTTVVLKRQSALGGKYAICRRLNDGARLFVVATDGGRHYPTFVGSGSGRVFGVGHMMGDEF